MMARRVLGWAVASVLAGCSFHAGNGVGSGSSGDDDGVDPTIDAHVYLDAPPCADTDQDTVCDTADICPGFDDRVDGDSDTIPDGCDDWPCGSKPAAPANVVTYDEINGANHLTVSLTGTTLNGTPAMLVVAPGANVTYETAYSIVDCLCVGCIDQIEVGLEPGNRDNCVYSGNPQGSSMTGCTIPTTGTSSHSLTAPTTPGVYDFRFKDGQDTSCGAHVGWWVATPPAADYTAALLCVH